MFISATDFKGSVNISQNKYTKEGVNDTIDEMEEPILRELLGNSLYDLFVADLDSNNLPVSQIYKNLFNPILSYNDCIPNTRGVVAMLKSFIYFYYVREQQNTNSSIGTSKSKGVASDLVYSYSKITKEYNKAINDYLGIQYFICRNMADYPTYKGIKKEYVISL